MRIADRTVGYAAKAPQPLVDVRLHLAPIGAEARTVAEIDRIVAQAAEQIAAP
jgi:hypothetical protein